MRSSIALTALGSVCLLVACSGQPRNNAMPTTGESPGTDEAPGRKVTSGGSQADGSGSSSSQTGRIGGPCETCEYMYLGMPAGIDSASTSPGAVEEGQPLLVTGTVFQLDGRTPAAGVIIYYWQTDRNGLYSPREGMTPGTRRHGHIRGWVRTGISGKYSIRTIRPAPYPDRDIPAHIHLAILEPGLPNEYYIDEINFDDDPLLLPQFRRHPPENRGGTGVVRVLVQGDTQVAEHNIVLGLHIPGYPASGLRQPQSGLSIGEDQPSFRPFHAFGHDRGSRACPVCKYGRYQGVIYFVGNDPDWIQIRSWLTMLEQESAIRAKYLKVYFVLGDEKDFDLQERTKQLVELGTQLGIKHTALTFVPSFTDQESEIYKNRIDPGAKNTFIIYRHANIVDKFTDLDASDANFKLIRTALDRTRGDYLGLPEQVPVRTAD